MTKKYLREPYNGAARHSHSSGVFCLSFGYFLWTPIVLLYLFSFIAPKKGNPVLDFLLFALFFTPTVLLIVYGHIKCYRAKRNAYYCFLIFSHKAYGLTDLARLAKRSYGTVVVNLQKLLAMRGVLADWRLDLEAKRLIPPPDEASGTPAGFRPVMPAHTSLAVVCENCGANTAGYVGTHITCEFCGTIILVQ